MSSTQTYDHNQPGEFKEGIQKLGERAGDLKDNLSGMAHDAASTAKAGAQELTKGVKQTVESGRKSAAQAIEGLSDRIAENPLTSIAIALAVGAVLTRVFFPSRA